MQSQSLSKPGILAVTLCAALMLLAGTGQPHAADDTAAPALAPAGLPTEFDAASSRNLVFEDMDYLLSKTVLPMGRSEHKAARRDDTPTGSRLRRDSTKPSRFEGNRVMYHFVENEAQAIVFEDVRDTLLTLPERVQITRLNRNEQLAYWLNLHNAIVLAEIADRYPIEMIDRLYDNCEEDERFACDRKFSLMGRKVSLMDIRNHVVINWDNPLVIYGFFTGAIGGPNIRPSAFVGESVYDDLQDNAVDFVNSVRGTRIQNDETLRVSTHYAEMAKFFPDFQADLLRHITKYAEPPFSYRLAAITHIRPVIDDWHIADLYNGYPSPVGASQITTVRDRRNQRMAFAYPPHVVSLLNNYMKRARNRRPNVVVEEVLRYHETAEDDDMDDEIAVAPKKKP